MNKELPVIYLARDGEAVWSIFSTGRVDLPLDDRGENNPGHLGDQFRERRFVGEITSPSPADVVRGRVGWLPRPSQDR